MSARPKLDRLPRTPRLGFVGLGWIGRKRLDAVAASGAVEVAALADADSARIDDAKQAYADAHVSPSLDALLDQELDGVVIATPNGSHAEQVVACLKRGLPVFCQKPLATSAADTQRVIEAARDADRLLATDFSYRHVQGMARLREILRAGELGEVLSMDLVFHNAYGPSKQWCHDRAQAGGGCLLDLGVHLVDLALWLQGSAELRVVSSRMFAQGSVRRAGSSAIEDLAYVELQQSNGGIVRIACSWHANIGCDAIIRADIHAQRGGASWYNVNHSFVDFNLEMFRGTERECIGASRDDWGPGALLQWIEQLRRDPSFDSAAWDILAGAGLIEEAYAA
ncbi:MAG TPA: Gfo/Idh/MocA family oxidoreductase [Steroidobacteraceae bacterium]|nr:Gfo/Idh/MocA family oxidoreductase [Steroidobacteraceae bacterium]